MADLSKHIVYHVPGMEHVTARRNLVYRRDGETDLLMNMTPEPLE